MNQQALSSYHQLLKDISFCRAKELAPLQEIECCFHMAERYWAMVRADLVNYEFEIEEEEIKFFKEIKPLFRAEAEYFSLRYHAQLFRDQTTLEDQPAFWKREPLRLQKFRKENQDFFDYYKSGCKDKDALWFMRTAEKESSSHDQLVTSLLALERYQKYVDQSMKLTP